MIARVTCSVIGFNANNLAAFDKAALRAALSAVDHAGVPIEGFNFFDRLSNGFRDRVHQEAACSDAKG
jgi:hypothetical protein